MQEIPDHILTFYPGEADGTAVPGAPIVVTSDDEDIWSDEAEQGKFFIDQYGETFFGFPECPYEAPEGYAFIGWRLNDSTFLILPGGSYFIGANDTAVAQWAPEYSITWTPTGKNFASWSKPIAAAGEGDRITIMLALSGAAYDAGWRVEKFVITGEDGSDITDEVTLIPTVTVQSGQNWAVVGGFRMPAQAVRVEAVFSAPLHGDCVLFFDEDFNVITAAAAGQTATVSVEATRTA